jgi:hypothetical protein
LGDFLVEEKKPFIFTTFTVIFAPEAPVPKIQNDFLKAKHFIFSNGGT